MTDRMSDGESKYNSSLDILERINDLVKQANYYSMLRTWDGYREWHSTLDNLDREISTYIDEKEEASLKASRFTWDVDRDVQRISKEPPLFFRLKLDTWDRTLRKIMAKKGMGIIAKEDLAKRMLE